MSKTKEVIAASNDFTQDGWYESLIKSIKQAVDEYTTESGELRFALKWAEVQVMHKIGQLVADSENRVQHVSLLVKEVSRSIKLSERNVYYCLSFVRTYPELQAAPEGKSISWNRLKKVYLTEGGSVGSATECPHGEWTEVTIRICGLCGKRETVQKSHALLAKRIKPNG